MSDLAIEIRDLEVRAGRASILSMADLRIARGEFVGLLGPNGSGKTTLLSCCMGFRRGRSGGVAGVAGGGAGVGINVLGRDILRLSHRELALLRRRIGYVRQMLPVGSETPLTVREVVAIGRSGIAGLLRPLCKDDHRIIDQWMERLGIADLAGRGYSEISGGQQRKVLIARAMVQQPELLLLDEPTANLDLGWRERIVSLIQELYAQGDLTVVLVCHELEVLPACCGRVAILNEGRMLADGEPETVLNAGVISRLYGDGLELFRRGGRMAVIPGGDGQGGGLDVS